MSNTSSYSESKIIFLKTQAFLFLKKCIEGQQYCSKIVLLSWNCIKNIHCPGVKRGQNVFSKHFQGRSQTCLKILSSTKEEGRSLMAVAVGSSNRWTSIMWVLSRQRFISQPWEQNGGRLFSLLLMTLCCNCTSRVFSRTLECFMWNQIFAEVFGKITMKLCS